MKRLLMCTGITAALIACFWGIVLVHEAVSRLPFEGKGTVAEPYQISTADDLRTLSDIVSKGTDCSNLYFAQTADIDLEHQEWNPIGRVETNTIFYGNYDGQCHTISGMKITEGENNALFGLVAGKIVNLALVDSEVSGTYVAGIVSHSIGNNAELVNCYSEVELCGERMGGIADNFSGTVRDCWSDCTFVGDGDAAGIVSYSALQIIECVTTHDLLVTDTFYGKIAGSLYSCEEFPEEPLDGRYYFEEQPGSDFEVIFGLADSDSPMVSMVCGVVYFILLVAMLWGAWNLRD